MSVSVIFLLCVFTCWGSESCFEKLTVANEGDTDVIRGVLLRRG